MGCDIHLYVEVREDGQWVNKPLRHTYDGRNYNLFAILAGVRNRHDILPISDPRGLPPDVSKEVEGEADGDHSHSWLTLAELMAFDWTQTAKLSGFVNGPEYSRWADYGKGRGEGPDGYCQGVGGGCVQHVSVAEMENLIKDVTNGLDWNAARSAVESLHHYYCLVEWESPYWRCASEFIGCMFPQLWRLGAPDDVRIVFWFDN